VLRLRGAFSIFLLAWGLCGCLLYTDPINEAPVVTVVASGPVYRGETTYFTVAVERESGPVTVRWASFSAKNEGCDWVTAAEWNLLPAEGGLSTDAPYAYWTESGLPICLCAMVADPQGATGVDCERVVAETPVPVARITDLAGAPVVTQRAKCSQIELSAAASSFLPFDPVQLQWTLDYSGPEPTRGKAARLAACADRTPTSPGAYQCFYAPVPGTYRVTLTVTDQPPGNMAAKTSPVTQVDITVLEDAPACLVQSSPEVTAKWILLARSTTLGSKYEARTFTVSSVQDDCEPFPERKDTSTAQKATFIWSVKDGTRDSETWEVQANPSNLNSFTVDQQSFPAARPGDTIGLRVEVRDTPAQQLFRMNGPLCLDSVPICCGSDGCDAGGCVRWTTWTVQFQP
jgi:hypothetical protein